MARLTHWLTHLCLFMCFTTSLGSNLIREMGSKTTISCSFKRFERNTTWQVLSGTDFINVTSCTFGSNFCVDYMPYQYHGEVFTVSDGYNAFLIISSVRRDATEFRCLSKYGYLWNTLEVYARPSNPVCDTPELDHTNKNLEFRCRARNVYPSLRAALYIRGVDLLPQDIVSSHCSNEEPDYLALNTYVAECVWRISAGKLEPLTYKYYVKMYPYLSDTTGINVPYVFSQDYTLQMKSSQRRRLKIGQQYTLRFSLKDFEKEVTVSVMAEDALIDVSKCNLNNETCVDIIPTQYQAHVSESLNGYVGKLVIERVKINETTFIFHNDDYTAILPYEVYAEPSNIVCDTVDVDYTRTNLMFRCTAENVYPAVTASLQIIGVQLTHEDLFSSHCSNKEPGIAQRAPYTVECTWRLPATKLEPLTYKYNVKMAPLFSNTTDPAVAPVASRDYTLQLRSPQAVIDYRHCTAGPGVLNGHLIPGTIASCRCVLETRGFPPGQARWYTLYSNNSVGHDNLVDGSSTLLLYNKTLEQRYQCQADSAFKNPLPGVQVYTPVFDDSSSGPDRHGFRVELIAGIAAGSAVLIIIVALLFWRCRNRNRRSLQMSSIMYNAHSDATSTTSIVSK